MVISVIPTITFNEPVRKTNGDPIQNSDLASLITLKKTDISGASVPFTATINSTFTVITITPGILGYTVTVPYGLPTVPVVTATTIFPFASFIFTPATSLPGTTNVLVTAQDGITQLTYTVTFIYAPPSINSVTFTRESLSNVYIFKEGFDIMPPAGVSAFSKVQTISLPAPLLLSRQRQPMEAYHQPINGKSMVVR